MGEEEADTRLSCSPLHSFVNLNFAYLYWRSACRSTPYDSSAGLGGVRHGDFSSRRRMLDRGRDATEDSLACFYTRSILVLTVGTMVKLNLCTVAGQREKSWAIERAKQQSRNTATQQ